MFAQRLLVLVVLASLIALVGLSYYVRSRPLIFLRRLLAVVVPVGVLTFVGLSSCDARYTDVSKEQDYAQWVGQKCVVLKGLRANGFTVDLRRKEVTHEVDVTAFPIAGPEITFTTPVPKGTTIVVKSVRKCWNCPFGRISYGIEMPEMPELLRYKVFARGDALAPAEARCTFGQ
jgi:hypothetical protein